MEGEHMGATENADAPEPMTADGSDGSEINPPKAIDQADGAVGEGAQQTEDDGA